VKSGRTTRALIAASATVLLASPARSAESLVTLCTSPSGWSYYPEQPLVPKKDIGWNKDGITGGSYMLIRAADGTFDVVYRDSTKKTSSSRDGGGDVYTLSEAEGQIVLLISYARTTVETWFFTLDKSGKGEVTVSLARFARTSPLKKHSLFRAACER
jgi:hypothetical protein